MQAVAEKIDVSCPQCGRNLRIPAESLGRRARCPSCSNLFAFEASTAAAPAEYNASPSAATEDWPPRTAEPFSPAALNPYASPPAPATATSEKNYNHGFGWEHRGWDKGMVGGLAMMGIAAVWFFVGLACGIVFYYPPILFVIGLVGFFRGLFTGNVAGR